MDKCEERKSARRSSAQEKDGGKKNPDKNLPADGGAKRKASPEPQHLSKRPRVSEVESSKDRPASRKRTATHEGEGPQKKKKKKKGDPELKKALSANGKRARFHEKYTQLNQLGMGGCGCVFAGFRKADGLPVAIKHIPKHRIYSKCMCKNGSQISAEVATMITLAKRARASGRSSAAVSLLDWYDLGQELVLVMERPVPAEDLYKYVKDKGGRLQEEDAKVIMKQLIDAAVELQDSEIFHRDIKTENILIQTRPNVPRVRLIDFGMSSFVQRGSSYRRFLGTPSLAPPESLFIGKYKPGPTTVWQLGIVLYEMLHRGANFTTREFLAMKLPVSGQLSQSCQDFLRACLICAPSRRPTLADLQRHPWLQ